MDSIHPVVSSVYVRPGGCKLTWSGGRGPRHGHLSSVAELTKSVLFDIIIIIMMMMTNATHSTAECILVKNELSSVVKRSTRKESEVHDDWSR